ncbi:MAG: hypothetical protein EU547_04940 [Promethearchaeota archaeon]|nr:MAG: hypothetical protein EU547_04940 [Candidatus Lokiarchaeota archaeon]
MDFITKLGKVSFQVRKLSDKVTELSKATLNIKALGPKLNNVIENQEELKREMKILKSLIYQNSKNNSNSTFKSVIEKETKPESNKKEVAITQIKELKDNVRSIDDYRELIERINMLREKLFDFTGGSKILYEISQILKEIKEDKKITSKVIEDIRAKADQWVDKLQD